MPAGDDGVIDNVNVTQAKLFMQKCDALSCDVSFQVSQSMPTCIWIKWRLYEVGLKWSEPER